MITYVTLFLPKICVKAKYIFGTEACACLDTSRRVLRSAEPSTRHETKRNKGQIQSRAVRSCALSRLHKLPQPRSAAFWILALSFAIRFVGWLFCCQVKGVACSVRCRRGTASLRVRFLARILPKTASAVSCKPKEILLTF